MVDRCWTVYSWTGCGCLCSWRGRRPAGRKLNSRVRCGRKGEPSRVYETPLGLTQQLSSFLPQRGVSAPWSPGFWGKPQRRIMRWVKTFQFTSNLVCLKRTEDFSQLIYKEIFLHHPRTWSSSGLKVHCGSLAFFRHTFSTGRSCQSAKPLRWT